MEFIRTLREKRQTAQQSSINDEALSTLGLSDFEGRLYIAYHGTPLIPIEDTWTSKEIIKKLESTRSSFIKYRKRQLDKSNAVAFF